MIKKKTVLVGLRRLGRKKFHGIILATVLVASGVPDSRAQQPQKKVGSAGVTADSASQTAQDERNQYRIGRGDQLSINFFGKAQLSREERVDMRGMIRMPLIDEDISAACRTENELADEIARMYRDRQLLKNPVVFVSVKDFQSQPVAVMGSVNSPGRFILQRRVRLRELLVFHAGGPSAKAGRKIHVLSTAPANSCEGSANHPGAADTAARNADDSVVTYDLKELLAGNEEMDPFVQQGDIINVPAAEEAIILGNVAHPAAVPIVEPLTLARSIALVGGTLPNSKKDKIRITRQIPGSVATTEFLVDMKASDKSKGEDFLLQGGDIVEVSTNTGLKTILSKLATSMVYQGANLPYRYIY